MESLSTIESSALPPLEESIVLPSLEELIAPPPSEGDIELPLSDESIAPSPLVETVASLPPKERPGSPVLYYADSQTYDRELGILILKGHVEFNHQGNVMEAEYVTYNEQADIVTASGNVRLRKPDGEIDFADYLELTGDMKEGILLQLRSLLEDDSKIVALEGRRFENRQELDQAVYTPCDLCGDKLPTWQINGRRVVKDDVKKDLIFTDAEFRFLDVPLVYLPYSTQPLERRSGYLPYLPHHTTDFGWVFELPYYIVLSDDKDITLTPVFYTLNNPQLLGEYRQVFGSGRFDVEGSIANYKKSDKEKEKAKAIDYHIPEKRGHVYGTYKQNLNDIWRIKLAGGYVSDKTYFRKYKFSGWQTENALTSKGILEGFLSQRDYAAVKTYHFQGLRVGLDDQTRISAPLPIIEYSAYSDTDPLGGRFKFDGNLLNLYREKGINMQRGIGELGWQRPWNTSLGQVFTVFASTRGDLYGVEHSHELGKREKQERLRLGESQENKGGARFFPQSGFDWRWPFINSFCNQSVVVQPVGQLIAASSHPIGASNREIPNEDSLDFEFNDANLFSPNRFPGYDRIDRGSRAVYGGEVLTTGSLFGDIELFLGQNYSFSDPQFKKNFQGLKNRLSDYVGRIESTPFTWLSLNYRFRLDQKSFHSRVSEVGGSLGPAIARLSGTYLFVSRRAGTPDDRNFNQANLTFSSQFAKEWSFTATIVKNFQKKTLDEIAQKIKTHHGILSQGVAINYLNDCFGAGIGVTQQNYKSADLKPATIFAFNFWLKNIGDYSFSYNPAQGPLGDKNKKEE
ncbi:MAG: LPS-assembly protein LptD [Alphaproteobacteria bacterium]|nr:LPS-assembly protein LptD [Alphaproteobacteria bacterium]